MSPRILGPDASTATRLTWIPMTDPEVLVDDGAGRLVAMGPEGVAYGVDITRHIVAGSLSMSPATIPAGADAPGTTTATPGHDATRKAPDGEPVEDAAPGLSPAVPSPPQDLP